MKDLIKIALYLLIIPVTIFFYFLCVTWAHFGIGFFMAIILAWVPLTLAENKMISAILVVSTIVIIILSGFDLNLFEMESKATSNIFRLLIAAIIIGTVIYIVWDDKKNA